MTECYNCAHGFSNQFQKDSCLTPIIPIKNCLFYKNYSQCLFCLYSYTLINNQCVQTQQEDCFTADEFQQKCIYCKGQRVSYKGRCLPQKCNDKNCRLCNKEDNTAVDSCLNCKPGYVVRFYIDKDGNQIGECIKGRKDLENCHIYDVPNNTCQICQVNYYMDGNRRCLKSSKYEDDLFKESSLMAGVILFLGLI